MVRLARDQDFFAGIGGQRGGVKGIESDPAFFGVLIMAIEAAVFEQGPDFFLEIDRGRERRRGEETEQWPERQERCWGHHG